MDAKFQEDEDSSFSALVNESQRFGLWAKNLGLYDLGHSSLDYIDFVILLWYISIHVVCYLISRIPFRRVRWPSSFPS